MHVYGYRMCICSHFCSNTNPQSLMHMRLLRFNRNSGFFKWLSLLVSLQSDWWELVDLQVTNDIGPEWLHCAELQIEGQMIRACYDDIVKPCLYVVITRSTSFLVNGKSHCIWTLASNQLYDFFCIKGSRFKILLKRTMIFLHVAL